MSPIVSLEQNFDSLLIPKDHPGRQPSDTYYINKDLVLRTHTSAHQSEALKSKACDGYLLSADVYRRDEIDPTHYPVFHQMEGIRLFTKTQLDELAQSFHKKDASFLPDLEQELTSAAGKENPLQENHNLENVALVAAHLKSELEDLMRALFVDDSELKIRWVDAYFPFTSPSWEMEIYYKAEWLEVLGCGIMQQSILDNNDCQDQIGWAFGLGLERIAMVLFDISDIRLFWSNDARFSDQFKHGKIKKFVPFSKYPACYKDISFWCPSNYHENDFTEIVRDVCGDLAEQVTLLDTFEKKGRVSRCYRVSYRSMERTLENKEIDLIDAKLRQECTSKLSIELR